MRRSWAGCRRCVEVAVDRLKLRFGVEVDLRQPRVPYLETIRKEARGHGRYKKQTGGRGQFGDCHIEIEPMEAHEGYEFIDKIVGGVIPQGFRPAVDKGIQEAMRKGELVGAPVVGVRVRLVDGSYHNVDSSEMAFRSRARWPSNGRWRQRSVLLGHQRLDSPSEENVGDVMGDMSSRRPGVRDGSGPGTTVIHVEVRGQCSTRARPELDDDGAATTYLLRYDSARTPPQGLAAAQRERRCQAPASRPRQDLDAPAAIDRCTIWAATGQQSRAATGHAIVDRTCTTVSGQVGHRSCVLNGSRAGAGSAFGLKISPSAVRCPASRGHHQILSPPNTLAVKRRPPRSHRNP